MFTYGMKLMECWACCMVQLIFCWAHQCSAYFTLFILALTMLGMWPSWRHPGKGCTKGWASRGKMQWKPLWKSTTTGFPFRSRYKYCGCKISIKMTGPLLASTHHKIHHSVFNCLHGDATVHLKHLSSMKHQAPSTKTANALLCGVRLDKPMSVCKNKIKSRKEATLRRCLCGK